MIASPVPKDLLHSHTAPRTRLLASIPFDSSILPNPVFISVPISAPPASIAVLRISGSSTPLSSSVLPIAPAPFNAHMPNCPSLLAICSALGANATSPAPGMKAISVCAISGLLMPIAPNTALSAKLRPSAGLSCVSACWYCSACLTPASPLVSPVKSSTALIIGVMNPVPLRSH